MHRASTVGPFATATAADLDLRRALGARLDATLAGRRPLAQLLDGCPPLAALTVVVADLAGAAHDWSALLGAHGEAPDPAQFFEPGLAQEFALGPCTLILFQPAEGTAADRFLRDHGDGLYDLIPRTGGGLAQPSFVALDHHAAFTIDSAAFAAD